MSTIERNPTWYQLKANVASLPRAEGMRCLADLLEDPPFELHGQVLSTSITWIADVGWVTAEAIIKTCPSVDVTQPIGELDQRSRMIVVSRLRGTAREIEAGITKLFGPCD